MNRPILTWAEKLVLGTGVVVLIAWLTLVSYLSATPKLKTNYRFGDSVIIKTGFYKGMSGYLVEQNKANGTYVISVIYDKGFLPVEIKVVATEDAFALVTDTTTAK